MRCDFVKLWVDDIRMAPDGYIWVKSVNEAKQKILKHLQSEDIITIAQVRDMFSTSRKSAKPILEYMDSIKVTKKTGGESERVAYL